jgi:DNA polymerase-3 subunit delta
MRLDYRGALKRVPQATGAWLLHGNEPLLEQNLTLKFKQHWQQQGIERQRFDINSVSDWRDVFNSLNSLSLFATQLAVEVHGNIKPDNNLLATLQQFIQSPADNLLLMVMPRQDQAAQKTRFYQMIDANGVVVPLLIQNERERQAILEDEAAQFGLKLQADAWQLLLAQTENNLFAAQQTLLKLRDVYDGSAQPAINAEMLYASLNEQSRYTSFELADAALQGNTLQAVKILRFLFESGEADTLILWALGREMRLLMQLMEQPNQYQKLGIWQNKVRFYQQALRQLKPQHTTSWPALLQRTDEAIKGVNEENPQDLLLQITLALCGKPLFSLH